MPTELSLELQKTLVREYCQKYFVSAGMVADICIHNKNVGNPHAHIMLTMRPFEQGGSWGAKSKKEYLLDYFGERIKLKSGEYKSRKIDMVDWNENARTEEWRSGWAGIVNQYFERENIDERIDHRSFERQGIEQIPSIHLGVSASQMEREGIATERGDTNRKIKSDNQLLKKLNARIKKLNNWQSEFSLCENGAKSAPPLFGGFFKDEITAPNLIETLINFLNSGQEQKNLSRTITDLKIISKAVFFLQTNDISDLPQLQFKVCKIQKEFDSVNVQLKTRERRIKVLTEHIKQAEIYHKYISIHKQYMQEKPKKQDDFYQRHPTEITLFDAADRYLKQVMNGHSVLPLKEWKAELVQLSAEREILYQKYNGLKEEVRDVEVIKRSIEQVLRDDEQIPKITRYKSVEL